MFPLLVQCDGAWWLPLTGLSWIPLRVQSVHGSTILSRHHSPSLSIVDEFKDDAKHIAKQLLLLSVVTYDSNINEWGNENIFFLLLRYHTTLHSSRDAIRRILATVEKTSSNIHWSLADTRLFQTRSKQSPGTVSPKTAWYDYLYHPKIHQHNLGLT